MVSFYGLEGLGFRVRPWPMSLQLRADRASKAGAASGGPKI